jgi:hypothetical protein
MEKGKFGECPRQVLRDKAKAPLCAKRDMREKRDMQEMPEKQDMATATREKREREQVKDASAGWGQPNGGTSEEVSEEVETNKA